MNSALTRPQSLEGLYRTYFSFANKFRFTDLLRNYIQNEEWKDTTQEQVWKLLSNVSDDIGAVLTDDIVNYTRNVVDINTCKVPQLIEHAKMLSYGLDSIKNVYGFFPKRICCLVDIFSINPEYLLGNDKNHILSDEVVKEILIYIRDNCRNRTPFTNEDVIDRLLDDPHGLTDADTYGNFVHALFYTTLAQALSAPYSEEDGQPIAFNVLWEEMDNQNDVLSRLDEYRSWVDRYIWNEIDHPLNSDGLANTLYSTVETTKNQKKMSSRFNPFKIADYVYFNGINPQHRLSDDELDLVETVIDYHSRTKYDYREQRFVDDMSTQYAYYRELEFFEWVKMVMFVMNNLKSFNIQGLTYDVSSNKFVQKTGEDDNCLRVVDIFNEGDRYIVRNSKGEVALNHQKLLETAGFLKDFVFHIQGIRENIKTIAQKHAMRGSGALLVHIVNDYLIKELPFVRDMMFRSGDDVEPVKFRWETDERFRNYGNVKVLEYEDDNEYFNIDPENDIRFTARTNARYWEQLNGMGYGDSLGVLTKRQIRDFYRDVLGMGRLQPKKPRDYDDIQDFLVDLFKIGANPISLKGGELNNPIDDILNKSEEDYGYTKAQRLEVQQNVELRRNQEKQFKEYSGNDDLIGNGIYELVNNKLFYWKNQDYSSHVLHPFMYNLKLWNKLNNIIVNGYRDYIDHDLEGYLSSKAKFDDLFGEFGETRKFWKYNVVDLTGYTTRYEAAIKDEHRDDFNRTTSELTGYDGLFYPDAIQEFVDLYKSTMDGFKVAGGVFSEKLSIYGVDDPRQCYWEGTGQRISSGDNCFISGEHDFVAAVYSIYWQTQKTRLVQQTRRDGEKRYFRELPSKDSFYTRWYSHLNYTRSEYQKIAMQLWYWRDRIVELATIEYPITKYCLDVQNNSLVLVSTFIPKYDDQNPFVVDLNIAQNDIQQNRSGNRNTHAMFCDNPIVRPSELWIRWKSNPIALPAFDLLYDQNTGDGEFDSRYRNGANVEFGQITHTNGDCNDSFKVVLVKWRERYGNLVHWLDESGDELDGNRLPVFFDMEQSANVLALASWYSTPYVDDGIEMRDGFGNPIDVTCCSKNPYHILSIERVGTSIKDYTYSKYSSAVSINKPGQLFHWMFDSYHYCQANGSILVPFYAFDCQDDGDEIFQKVKLRMFLIPAQQLKTDNYTANDRLIQLADVQEDVGGDHPGIDLNKVQDFHDQSSKYRFDHPIRVCRNTNLVFSTYEHSGMNKVRIAFLGTFVKKYEGLYPESSYTTTSIKRSTADAETRYEYDSQSIDNLALTKRRYYSGDDSMWTDGEMPKTGDANERRYVDLGVVGNKEGNGNSEIPECFNSYDSMDKFVMVVDIDPSIDVKSLFDISWQNGLSFQSYNILSDAGCIPHFAYQSLVAYSDRDGGTAYTWRNPYLEGKEHMQFELLGLDDKRIPDAYDEMRRMIVDDTTDGCKTRLNPAKFIDDIYRIWCENEVERSGMYFPYYGKWQTHFKNEYWEMQNPELEFNDADDAGTRTVEWNAWEEDPDTGEPDTAKLFEIEIPSGMDSSDLDSFKSILSDYYITVARTDNGEILNEKRYILPPTSAADLILDMNQTDGYTKCRLGKWQSATIDGDHFATSQVVFVGTPNPFNYSENGERLRSRPEELQYGNSIQGVDEMWIKVDVVSAMGKEYEYGGNGYLIYDADGREQTKPVQRKYLKVRVKFVKNPRPSQELSLTETVHRDTDTIPAGSVTVMLSHKNLENIARYHILNRSSDLYFNGSLPKNGRNQYKFSDFKYSEMVNLKYDESSKKWISIETKKDEFGNESPVLEFSDTDIRGDYPPYCILGADGEPVWFLQQGRWNWMGTKTEQFSEGQKIKWTDENGLEHEDCHPAVVVNGNIQGEDYAGEDYAVEYPVPAKGNFVAAHRVKSRPEKYLDYLYVANRGLAFKVNEESHSFAEAMTKIPPFHIDTKTKNKLQDLNDVQILKDYSTFIHQSERPQKVKDCGSFNPLIVDAVLKYGELGGDGFENPTSICIDTEDADRKNTVIQLDNMTNATRLQLQLEDGEIDDYLKIYTNYVRKDDGFGDFHYDLYFNVQNLFNSPFEYISTVTNQPNVLILQDSYLYLTGDKFKPVYVNGKRVGNEVDVDKVNRIKDGGELSLYGQVKVYSDDKLSDVRTIKLFTYRIYNVSDDKPKFLIEKTYDITKTTLYSNISHKVKIEFEDVMWTVDENDFRFLDENENETDTGKLKLDDTDKFRILDRDVTIVQPLHIRYNWNKDDDYRINSIKFDILNDIIDFDGVPELCGVYDQSRTLRNWEDGGSPYYDHWSDRYMKLEKDETTGRYAMTLTYGPGFNFETVYLKWRLPSGCRVMDTIDRLGGYVFSSTAQNIVVDCNSSSATPIVDVRQGHVTARVHKPNKMYLGIEHGTKIRKSGFVLIGLADAIKTAIRERGEKNPTIKYGAIPEDEISGMAAEKLIDASTTGLAAPRKADSKKKKK